MRNVTEYLPGSPAIGGNEVRMCGSSIVNSSCMSLMPEYGSQISDSGSYLEMYEVNVYRRCVRGVDPRNEKVNVRHGR